MFLRRRKPLSLDEQFERASNQDLTWVADITTMDSQQWADLGLKLAESVTSYSALSDIVKSIIELAPSLGERKSSFITTQFNHSFIKRGRVDQAFELANGMLHVFPSSQSLMLELSRAMFRQGRVEELRNGLGSLMDTKNAWVARGALDLALAARHYPALERAVQDFSLLLVSKGLSLGGKEGLRQRLNKSAAFLQLRHFNRESSIASLGGDCDTPVYCINLDRDIQRYRAIEVLYDEIGITPIRHVGIFGAAVPKLAFDAIFRTKRPVNAIGCTMSHIAVWERIANQTEGSFGLVVEDDGLPSFAFSLDEIVSKIPQSADLCFVNDRVDDAWMQNAAKKLKIRPILESWASVSDANRAIGADGYLLSQGGAEKLLDITAKHGIVHSVDWQMYSLGFESLPADKGRHVDAMIQTVHKRIKCMDRLNVCASSLPLICHSPLGYTPRSYFN